MRALVLLFAPMLLLPLTADAAAGAYVGVGASSACRPGGSCDFEDCETQIALRPSHLEGRWAADMLAVVAHGAGPCASSFLGLVHWPSHVLDDLEGSPEAGFAASGTAAYTGTSNGVVLYRLAIGPLSSATEWSLLVSWDETFENTVLWSGTADFRGAHL